MDVVNNCVFQDGWAGAKVRLYTWVSCLRFMQRSGVDALLALMRPLPPSHPPIPPPSPPFPPPAPPPVGR